jgi:hypothetical protein
MTMERENTHFRYPAKWLGNSHDRYNQRDMWLSSTSSKVDATGFRKPLFPEHATTVVINNLKKIYPFRYNLLHPSVNEYLFNHIKP